jgi:hypothetical protein
MGDPERLLGPGGCDELERELLGSIRDVSPPPGAKGQAWEGIAVQIAAASAIGAGAAAAQAATGTAAAKTTALGAAAKALTAKVVIGVALGGTTLAAGGYWAAHRRVEPPTVEPSPNLRPAPEPIANAPAATVAADPPTPPDRPSRPIDEPRQRNLLAIESRMLTEARAELRGGDARAAMATLDRMQARFPKGVLTQEREVLTIQVLAALGEGAAASRKAREFLQAYPNSPHAPQLRHYAGEP